jgi:hypothetical protein
VRHDGGELALEFAPVEFTRVRPGESLLQPVRNAA